MIFIDGDFKTGMGNCPYHCSPTCHPGQIDPDRWRYGCTHKAWPQNKERLDLKNKMKCSECIGTYKCCYVIMLPWRLSDGSHKYACIDKCLLPEILLLWEKGIKTTGCCCGHGKNRPYIGVFPEYIESMKFLGYSVQFNACRPNDEDTFTPKTIIKRTKII